MCHIRFPGQRCYRGRGICHATPEEACTVGRITKSKLWVGGRKEGRRKLTGRCQPEERGGAPFTPGDLSSEWLVPPPPSYGRMNLDEGDHEGRGGSVAREPVFPEARREQGRGNWLESSWAWGWEGSSVSLSLPASPPG